MIFKFVPTSPVNLWNIHERVFGEVGKMECVYITAVLVNIIPVSHRGI